MEPEYRLLSDERNSVKEFETDIRILYFWRYPWPLTKGTTRDSGFAVAVSKQLIKIRVISINVTIISSYLYWIFIYTYLQIFQ